MNTSAAVGEIIEQVVRRSAKVIGGKAIGKFDKRVANTLEGNSTAKDIGRLIWRKKATAIDIGVGIYGYKSSRDEGKSVTSSIGQGLEDALIPLIAGPFKYLGVELLASAPDAAIGLYEKAGEFGRSVARSSNQTFSNASFQDNQQIATMRQAEMALAEQSQFNLKKAMLGNEASNYM